VLSMDNNEIRALLNLLDDPDEEVYSHVKSKLLSMGQPIIPVLENAWEMGDPFNTLIQTRIEGIIHNIQFENVASALKNWAEEGAKDLLTGTILITKYQYPDLNEEKINKKLELISKDVWLELNVNLTALEKVRILNHIIFDVHGFSGNTSNYHAPQNSYINNVIESKKGNPLSLSILYAIVAQNLGIPIYGVNLPQHFILAYMDFVHGQKLDEENVLFYINPFSRGAVFTRKEIDAFLKQLNLDPNPIFYKPCSNLDIVKRLLQNLIYSYEKLGYISKQQELQNLLNKISGK
jgi:regulator of sirC expression with transglutaminase-like and TPR domain